MESAAAETTDEGLSFAERLLKRCHVENAEVAFIDSSFLFPTSHVCDLLLSEAGYALSDRRRRIAPMNFEQQIFLHADRTKLDIADLSILLDCVLFLRQLKLVGHSLFTRINTSNIC